MRVRPRPGRLFGLAIAVAATLAPAAPAAAVTEITVSGGYAGHFVPGRHVPVAVQIDADRLLRGTLEVVVRPEGDPDMGVSRVRLPIEVPGGSRKSFFVVAPPAMSFGPPGAVVTATLLDAGGGKAVATSRRQSLRADASLELVGILPGSLTAGDPPPTAPLAVDSGVARLVELGRAELAQAPASLAPLGTIAAGADDLAPLAEPVRRALLRWLGDGGTLLVDAPPGTPVDGLPEAWQPGGGGFASAGLGRVRLTDGAMAAGRWDRLVEPTTAPATNSEFGFGGPGGSLGDALAVDAGLRVPGIGWLLAFLVLYVVVVGPVTAVVLGRRRRAELAWLVIPAVAVVFTGLSYVGARQVRGSTKLAHGTTVEFDAGGARSTTFVGLAARGREAKQISFPDGWTASANPTTATSRFTGAPATTSTELTRRGPAARLELGAGQFGIASAAGPAQLSGRLAVTARSDGDGQSTGTIRNDMPYALEEAAVFVGSSGAPIGRLKPGEERRWAIPGDAAHRAMGDDEFGPIMGAEGTVWPETTGRFGRVDHDSVVNFPLWQTAASNNFMPRPAGVAVAVGWTREHRPPVLVDGERRRPVGRTAVIARAPVDAGDRITDYAVRSEMVRGPGAFFAGPGREGRPLIVIRSTLPAGRQPAAGLVASVFEAIGGVPEVWVDGRWQALQPEPDGAQGQATDPEAPADSPPSATTVPGPVQLVPARGMPPPRPPPAPAFRPPDRFGDGGAFGPSRDYAIPARAVNQGLLFLRLPAEGHPRHMTVAIWERGR
ncbi:MAG: hypothetical protein KY447_06015 [Actinobacteria bacterium]|nr:hypothetical protein [Actinomycetota bacterium]